MCRSKALTLPNNFLLFLRAIRTSLFALTDLVSRENGPTLKVYYWGLWTGFSYSIFANDMLSNKKYINCSYLLFDFKQNIISYESKY